MDHEVYIALQNIRTEQEAQARYIKEIETVLNEKLKVDITKQVQKTIEQENNKQENEQR